MNTKMENVNEMQEIVYEMQEFVYEGKMNRRKGISSNVMLQASVRNKLLRNKQMLAA